MFLIDIISCKKNLGQNRKKVPTGGLEPGGLYLQKLKIRLRLCFHKTQPSFVITYPLSPITKSIITIFANVAELPPPPFICK